MKSLDKKMHEGTGGKENHFTVYGDMLLDVLQVVYSVKIITDFLNLINADSADMNLSIYTDLFIGISTT